MPAYLIANYDVVDAEQYRAYQKQSGPIMQGGRLLVLDPASDAREGECGQQTVVIEYESKEAATAAYESADYQAVMGIRLDATANGRAVIVDGFVPPR